MADILHYKYRIYSLHVILLVSWATQQNEAQTNKLDKK